MKKKEIFLTGEGYLELENELNYLKSRIDKYEEDRDLFITLIKNSKLDIEELENLIEEKEDAES